MTLTRIGATELLYRERHMVTGVVLELGVGSSPYAEAWDASITLDIDTSLRPTVAADAHFCPFRDGAFDTIVASQVFEHLSRPWLAAGEVARVLRPGGTLLVAVPFLYWLHQHPADYYRYTEWGLRSIFNEWFEISSIQAYGGRFAVVLDMLFSMTRSSRRWRRGLYQLRDQLHERPGRGRRRRLTGSFLLRVAPGEHPLGYVLIARRRPPAHTTIASGGMQKAGTSSR